MRNPKKYNISNDFHRLCPICGRKIYYKSRDAWITATKRKTKCSYCRLSWQQEKFGEKNITEYESNCPECGGTKKHTCNPSSITAVNNFIEKDNNRLCRSCSNSLYYTVASFRKNTKPEREFKKLLEDYEIEYIQNYKVKTKWYDFYIPDKNLLVEVDGVYWHGKGLQKSEMNSTQKHNHKNDLFKNELATKEGYSLVRIWEDEINNNTLIKLN